MNQIKKTLLVSAIIIYEFILIDYAGNNFSLAKNWFTIVGSMPVSESNVEFVIFLGQTPLIIISGWLWLNKRKKMEEDLLSKYGKNKNI